MFLKGIWRGLNEVIHPRVQNRAGDMVKTTKCASSNQQYWLTGVDKASAPYPGGHGDSFTAHL